MNERKISEADAMHDFRQQHTRLAARPEQVDRVWAYQETILMPGTISGSRLALFATGTEGRVRITVAGKDFSVNYSTDDEPTD